jgi:hypothetical protein
MSHDDERRPLSRRKFLKRAGAVGLGSIAARGVYETLDEVAGGPQRAQAAAVIRRFQEQYLIDQIEVIVDNGVTVAIPPLHNDVFTATPSSTVNWTAAALKNAKTRLENAVAKVEAPYPSTAAGLTIVIGWGLPYFRTFTPGSCFGVTVGPGSGKRSASHSGRGPHRRSSGLRRSYLRATRRAQASGRGAGSRRDGGRSAQEASASTPRIAADTPSLAPSRDAMWRAAAPP